MSKFSRLFVHEYVTGGGCSSGELAESLVGEASAMLLALLADFGAWGRLPTLTTLDWRLAHLEPAAGEVIVVGPDQYASVFRSALARCDAALIIAPETGGVLARLNEQVQAAGLCLLGSEPEAVRLAGDKWACYQRWQTAGVPTPLTVKVAAAAALAAARALGYPLVVKPLDGAGCSGVALARDEDELAPALGLAEANASDQPILLQRYVAGKAASAALLAAGDRVVALSLNGQEITPGRPFSYRGGVVPLRHPAAARALEVAQAAAAAVPGLRGYLGVDMVLAGDQAWAIELNPRLTTAYIGLRRVAEANLAHAIWEVCVEGALPDGLPLTGQARFGPREPGGQWEAR